MPGQRDLQDRVRLAAASAAARGQHPIAARTGAGRVLERDERRRIAHDDVETKVCRLGVVGALWIEATCHVPAAQHVDGAALLCELCFQASDAFVESAHHILVNGLDDLVAELAEACRQPIFPLTPILRGVCRSGSDWVAAADRGVVWGCGRHGVFSSQQYGVDAVDCNIIAGMALPVEFQNELQAWLDARLDERLVAERKTMLEMVLKLVAVLFDEHIQRDGEAHKKELEQEFSKIQATLDRMEGVLEHQADRIDRAARGEPVDRLN